MKTFLTNNDVSKILSFLPLAIWSVNKGFGSFVTFDAGEKIIKKKKGKEIKYVGQLHIWIYLCDWELYHNNKILLSSEIEDKKIYDKILHQLIGLPILKIEEYLTQKNVKLTFGENFCIYLKNNLDVYEKEDDLLMIFIENQAVLSYSLQNGFYIEPV